MKQMTLVQNSKNIKIPFLRFFKRDIVFTITFTLAIASSLIQAPQLESINLRVLISLFNLMIAIKAFEELKLLDRLAIAILKHCSNSRQVSAILIMLAFLSSMFVTNDVALITFVPLAMIISKTAGIDAAETVILQTVAANIGSSLTPMGNPQNLFIFSFFHLKSLEFFSTMGSFAILGITILALFLIRFEPRKLKMSLPGISKAAPGKNAVWMIVFTLIIASVLGGLSYKLAFFIVISTVLFVDRSLLVKIDYFLLFTFISFFIFIGNLSNIDAIHSFIQEILSSSASVYFTSIIASQFISNVPTAILLAKFTNDWQPLLLGVNVGGLGTLIASLASLISYKLFSSQNPQEAKNYLIKFSFYNLGLLIVLALVQYFLFRILL